MSDELHAFPAANAHAVLQEGMTLRDWFAGQALSGILSIPTSTHDPDGDARAAYEYADAMLRAREAK